MQLLRLLFRQAPSCARAGAACPARRATGLRFSASGGYLILLALGLPLTTLAQTSGSVGIGTTTPAASAALDVSSTTQGLLPPRLTSAQRAALTSSATAPPVPGLVIYQTDGVPGLYLFDGAAWTLLHADNLGNHTATQNLNLNGQKLTGGGSAGLLVPATGDATATVQTQPLLRLVRPTTPAVKWPNELQIGLGSYGTGVSSQSRADFSLIDGASNAPDRTVLTLLASGAVGIGTTSPQARLHVAGGAVRLDELAGRGARMVVADADGTLGTQALPGAPTTDTAVAPTASLTLTPGVGQLVYTDNAAANGTITLSGGTDGQTVVLVNRDAQYLPVVANGRTANLLPGFAARYVYSTSDNQWRRQN